MRLLRLFKSSLKLSFVLILINLLRSELSSLISQFFQGFDIANPGILNMVSLLFVIYYGYFILTDSRFFLNKLTATLGPRKGNESRAIVYDIAGIISLLLMSQLLTPLLGSLPGPGSTAATVADLVLLCVGIFLVYHLLLQAYTVAKQHIEALIEERTKQQGGDQASASGLEGGP
jgi:predicted PurR-regulated permease PerM